jgi:hypothetical protein
MSNQASTFERDSLHPPRTPNGGSLALTPSVAGANHFHTGDTMEHIVYHTTGSLTPKQRLIRLLNGLLADLHLARPELSIEERRKWLGLTLLANKRQLVNQTMTRLETR